jgi:GTP cyclohydrolase IIa
MSIGFGKTPFEANIKAHEGRTCKKYLNKEHNILGFVNGSNDDKVTIMHFDIENLTSKRATTSPYELSSVIFKIYARMSEFFLNKKSMAFFMGGDNFIVITNHNAKQIAKEFLDTIKSEHGIILNCGIGTAITAREAVKLATKSLDTIRQIRDSGKEKPEIYEIS